MALITSDQPPRSNGLSYHMMGLFTSDSDHTALFTSGGLRLPKGALPPDETALSKAMVIDFWAVAGGGNRETIARLAEQISEPLQVFGAIAIGGSL